MVYLDRIARGPCENMCNVDRVELCKPSAMEGGDSTLIQSLYLITIY
jgi:hypothetical protein